jgi:chemotaxis protein methyltransferase CheR
MAFTFFFRDLPTLESAVDLMVARTMGRSKIRVWVAGCAMGQEVYTLAILLAEKMGYFAFQNLTIEATDIEAGFGEIVRQGRYPRQELERIPDHFRARYFTDTDSPDHLQVVEPLRRRVVFHHQSLLDLQPIGDGLSLIVCKNVLLHFQPDERVQVFRMFHRALAAEAILANENTQKLPAEVGTLFEQLCPDAQVYRRRELSETSTVAGKQHLPSGLVKAAYA